VILADKHKSPQTPETGRQQVQQQFHREVDKREKRKLKARREGDRGVWFGFGMFGLVGWSVTIPTVAGIALGIWIDAKWPSRFSWTLMLLVAGVGLGCFNAWRWVEKERKER
jgi:ATP synthase protein I